jgi:serine/threonine protein kinase/tetratricopeptide (TPR) repeat protein
LRRIAVVTFLKYSSEPTCQAVSLRFPLAVQIATQSPVCEITPKSTVSHYHIISKLGSGGMGEVYLAQDTKLDRKVALKILPSALAANQGRMRRFVQEAKCAAALNHPNIAHIYEIGEAENQGSSQTVEAKSVHFIAMEFIDGHTLREEIHHERTPLSKLLKYLNQVTDGLAKAHAAGIIHRDLKPDNIMISRDGHAKILDFGLAKLVEATERPLDPEEVDSQVATVAMPQRTSPGAIMGTVGYMSPEQVKAETLDQRSDIFSFGCVLYEAVTGRKPFAGDSVVDTLHKILHDPAPAIADSNPNAPAELQRIIRRCLTKEPEKRYQTIRDTANDLEEVIEELKGVTDIERSVVPSTAVSSGPGTADVITAQSTHSLSQPTSSAEYVVSGIRTHKLGAALVVVLLFALTGSGYWYWSTRGGAGGNQINSIAVLPFVNENGNPDVEYLSDGMTESLINSLSNLPNLSVKARNSVFRYKGTIIDEKRIGQDLSVDALLLGRVLQRGDNVTLYLSLVDVRTGASVWGEQYDRKMQDIAILQKDIASDVSRKLRTRLSNAEAKHLTRNYTDNSEAYQLYLKGRFFWNKRTPDSVRKATEYFEQAIQKDPGFALAYTGLADSYVVPANRIEPHVAMPKAKTAALQALAIDETLAEAHTSLARVLQVYDWDWTEAEKEFKRAIELNPRYAVAHQWYGGYLERTGRVNEAISERKLAIELDPLSTITIFELGSNYLYSRKYDQAIAQFQRALELDPDFPAAHQFLPLAYVQKGMYEEALAKIREAPDGAGLNITGMPGYVYAVSGRISDARKELEELKRRRKTEYITAVSLAYICVGLGERDEAMSWLEKGFEERAFQMQFLKVDPRLDNLRDDPRFKELVRKIGFP